MIKIEIENNVFSKASGPKDELQIIWDALSYESTPYVKGRNGKVLDIKNRASFFNKKTKIFMTGFIRIIKKELRNKNIPFQIIPPKKIAKQHKISHLPGNEKRDYQTKVIKKCLKQKRANVISKTGSGKTTIFNTIINTLNVKTLVLCRRKDIHLKNYGLGKDYFKNVSVIESGNDLSWQNSDIVFSTPQTMSRIDPIEYVDYFDLLILDESHLVAQTDENILMQCNAEWRFSFTGSWPSDPIKQLTLTGLFGDKIIGLKDEDAHKFLSPIKVQLRIPPFKFCNSRRYEDIYNDCIVNNQGRNEMIIGDAIERVEKNMSGLIMTNRYEQGYNLQKIAKQMGYDFIFINGKTKDEERISLQKKIDTKEESCIITNIWKEGIDIESLNFVIVGFGHKAEDRLVQIIGRPIRKHESKEYGEVIDYIDKQLYLGPHSLERIEIYIKQGWI